LEVEYARSWHIGVITDGTVGSPPRLHYTFGCAARSDDIRIKNLHEIFVIERPATQSPRKGFPLYMRSPGLLSSRHGSRVGIVDKLGILAQTTP
jgi:hypothetical protein